MSTAAVGGHHSGAGPLSLMSCVRESSPQPENERGETEKNTSSKKKFWNPKRWFKRKQSNDDGPVQQEVTKDAVRSRSTSELSDVEDDVRRRSTSSMHPTLSLSHDSVFQSPHSGSSDMELDAAQSSSSLSISQPFNQNLKTELCGRLRLRRGHGDTSEDDEGLPRSPCNSPTTADGHHHKTANKDLPTKSHSTCSDGSLRSVDSSEMDEDSYGLNSRHSSKLSLQDKRNVDLDSDIELGPSSAAQPLNHSAAHHKVSVRPKRTHGAPRRRRAGQSLSSALPATPEVNEDSSVRSVTPDNAHKVGPGAESKLNRSKSNSGSKSQDHFAILNEPKEEKADKPFFRKLIRNSGKKKKAKEKHQEHLLYTSSSQTTEVSTTTSTSTTSTRIESKPIVAPRSTAATRQRVVPKNIPITPEQEKREVVLRKPSPEKPLSPFDSELENRIKQRQTLISTSPPKISTPPQSPKVSRSPVLSELENVMKHRQTILSTSPSKSKSPPMSPKALRSSPVIIKTEFTQKVSKFAENVVEEKRSKVKLGSLSALQRKILSSTEKDDDDAEVGYKSLTEVDYKSSEETKIVKPVMKSHSFKTVKEDVKATIAKASSTDSIKVAEAAPPATYDNEFKIEFRTTPKTQPEENYDSISSDILKDVKEITNELVAEIKDDFVAPTDKSIKDKTNELIMSEAHNVDVFNDSPSGITISGPSHTAIVNVTSNSSNDTFIKTTTETTETKSVSKESQVSVTKIQLKHETINTTAMGIPEFMNKQLNKVEPKPEKNVIFTMSTPKSEKTRPATSVSEDEANIEIIEKAEVEVPVEEEKKPAPVSAPYRIKTQETPKKRSPSPDRSSQESVDSTEPVVMRKKSVIASPKNDEPSELMKVFAKRSRIFNDSEADAIAKEINEARTRDSDKENDIESPVEERKKIPPADTDAPAKEPLIESSNTETVESTAEVTLRKPIKNSVPHGRSFSLHYKNTEVPFKKPVERRMVSSYWNKNESSEEIITTISQKEEKIVEEISIEPKNFNQRKAEWEKRAQLAQKNNVP